MTTAIARPSGARTEALPGAGIVGVKRQLPLAWITTRARLAAGSTQIGGSLK